MRSNDKRYHIVYNGEVYNYVELRAELEQRGCVFHTQSDTEVLLNQFVLDGVDALTAFATGCSRSRFGTVMRNGCSWRAIASASSRSTTASATAN